MALLLLGVPEASLAATADLQIKSPNPSSPPNAIFTYGAALGEANDLVVDISLKAGLLTITATDGGAAISPGSRCAATAANSVKCSYQATSPGSGTFFYVPTSTVIRLGEGDDSALFRPPALGGEPGIEDALNVDHVVESGTGDDRVTIAAAGPIVSFSRLRGGPGDDVLLGPGLLDGGGGRDELHGFPGSELTDGDTEGSVDADILDGGGAGQVDYGSRTRPLHIDLQQAAAEGERGEGDRITGVTRVVGGRANDFLGGTLANDTLAGGRGDDQIHGRGGDDIIVVNGRDQAFGGPGNDEFEGGVARRRSFQPTVVCGPGKDTSLGASDGPGPWLSRTCESVADNLHEDAHIFVPTQPVAASRAGRLVFELARFCQTGTYRLTLTSGRAPLRRLATRRIETKAGHCAALRRVAVTLPRRLARRAQHRPVRLRERIDVNTLDEPSSLVWRFDLRLSRR